MPAPRVLIADDHPVLLEGIRRLLAEKYDVVGTAGDGRELVAAADPFPANAEVQEGLLVEAKVGKGTWTYVGLGLFRQLPAGTPGAYRLLANLLSRPRGR